MINVTKTITDNPFVDNVIYYAKYLALNSTVKDEKEALSNETAETLKAGDTYIACIEGWAKYEMYTSIPISILAKYIEKSSNIDIMINDNNALKAYLNSLSLYDRTAKYNNITKLAQTIYIDHYNIMMNYIQSISEDKWNKMTDLYNLCCADEYNDKLYESLFDEIPKYTMNRIIYDYINNYDGTDMSTLVESLDTFRNYVNNRSDNSIKNEMKNVNNAIKNVYKSHYEMMKERQYITTDENSKNWYDFIQYTDVYDLCLKGEAKYDTLYGLFPKDDLYTALSKHINPTYINMYNLCDDIDSLKAYFNNISMNPSAEMILINKELRDTYINNYNMYLNYDVYNKCRYNEIKYYELSSYLPKETQKIILYAFIDEISNLEVYANNKTMLNSYLNSLPKDVSDSIKESINKDMIIWYPKNHVEKNNYYRTFLGLPPLKSDGTPYEDTLMKCMVDETNGPIYNFGMGYINDVNAGSIFDESHWKLQLYEFDNYDIARLNDKNILESYVQACGSTLNSKRFAYLKFLGDSKLDLYTCRKALNFELIGVPTIDTIAAKNKFTEFYAINRDYIVKTVYSDAYDFQSDYYTKFIMIFIMINTIMDMLTDIPRMLIDREVFDSRCIRFLFESFGIPFYAEIPIKYQQAMLKNLNTLIKYKSSTKNMIDICNLFGFADIKVFKYYMFKEKVKVATGEYVFNDNTVISYDLNKLYVEDNNGKYKDYNDNRFTKLLEAKDYSEDKYLKTITILNEDGSLNIKKVIDNDADVYIYDKEYNYFIPFKDVDYFRYVKADTATSNLKFIKVPIGESLTDYKSDGDYILKYDDVVYGDDTWDGGLNHDMLKQRIIDYDFNAVLTKYISIETVTEMTELSFQISYFYNMLFGNLYSEDNLTLEIPFIKVGHKFRFMDVICYLFSLMYFYNGVKDNIMYSPTQILYVKGYHFDQSLNGIFTDPKYFINNESSFDINERIIQDNYDYKEAFSDKRMRAFNLSVDMDALDIWLAQYQLSLDDFVVEYNDDPNKIITLRNFYSVNNSFYQKNIFSGGENLYPYQYNQNVKYSYNQILLKKKFIKDLNMNTHSYVTDDIDGVSSFMEIINSSDNDIYVLNNNLYISMNGTSYALYNKYEYNGILYNLNSSNQYIRINNEYKQMLPNGDKFIKDQNGNYIFATFNYYKLIDGVYTEITSEDNYYTDGNGKTILKYGTYYVFKNGEYVLNPDNCYVKVYHNKEYLYILYKDIDKYEGVNDISPESCYILHSDGHFIPLVDTDFYRKNENGEYEYNEEICYVRTDEVTEYFDPSDDPIIYYKKLNQYYDDSKYNIFNNEFYIMDSDGRFISEAGLISPENCYYREDTGDFYSVSPHLAKFIEYTNPLFVDYLLILDYYNNYNVFRNNNNTLDQIKISDKIYAANSDNDYLLVLLNNFKYDTTNSIIIVFNKEVVSNTEIKEVKVEYDPEVMDKVWDENDWFYTDESYDPNNFIGMNGENKWYYKKPGQENTPVEEDVETPAEELGSGFYFTSIQYLGNVRIIEGEKYFLSMDIDTNFSGYIQICCESDSEYVSTTSRLYNVKANTTLHISQLFTANDNPTPNLRFIIYNFDKYPIHIGDYVIVKNIRLIKTYNDNYISQDIPSYEKLQELYKTNEKIYKYLLGLMNNCSDFHKYEIYKKLYDSLVTAEYNKEAFKIGDNKYARTYTEFLQTRDSILYEKLKYFLSLSEDTMHKEIADDIIEVTYAVNEYIDTYTYGYLYSYFPAVSASYIQQYISKIINFFKSWKVHLLGINTLYKFDAELDNRVKILEHPEYKVKMDNQIDYTFISDSMHINPMDSISPDGNKYSDKYPDMFKFTNSFSENVQINDTIRIISKDANMIKYTDNYENIHLMFSNDEIEAYPSVDGNLIVGQDSGLSVSIPNNLILDDKDDEINRFGAMPLHRTTNNTRNIK